jgi:hypothetical protein
MNIKYLEELIKKTQNSLEYRVKKLKEYEMKVETFKKLPQDQPEIEAIVKESVEWVDFLNKSIKEDTDLLDICFTARDLKCKCK